MICLADHKIMWIVLDRHQKIEHELISYFSSKPKGFYKHSIYELVDIWFEVLGSNGGYIND